MITDLQAALPLLLPRAVAWAEEQQGNILALGFPLSPEQVAVARGVGVAHPENIRIKLVDALPLPQDRELAAAALQAGLLGPTMTGLTLFYGIFICRWAYGSRSLVAHECRHVHQHEQRGSIAVFLQEYLLQIVTMGYEDATLEQDARRAAAVYT
ncbi:MAG TPA: hypothetical protein DCZ05_04500 [Deltaproteobacteria bacterium]|nr:hypothetical protein [Deltaproteobacteria bacterium]